MPCTSSFRSLEQEQVLQQRVQKWEDGALCSWPGHLGGMLQLLVLMKSLGYCIQVGTKSANHLVGSQLMNEAAEGGGQCKHQIVEHGRIPLPCEEDLKIGQRMRANRSVLQH